MKPFLWAKNMNSEELMAECEQRIRECLVIDETSPSGLRWNHMAAPHVRDKPAGTMCGNGYWQVAFKTQLKRHFTLAHRVIWFLANGCWPKGEIDHINGNRADNRLSNLRAASRSENMCNSAMARNNSSGAKGVYFDKSRGKWKAQIEIGGERTHLGRFDDIADAKRAVMAARNRLHGKFANHGMHNGEGER